MKEELKAQWEKDVASGYPRPWELWQCLYNEFDLWTACTDKPNFAYLNNASHYRRCKDADDVIAEWQATQIAEGRKLDVGKQLSGLVIGDFAQALQEVVKVGTFGAGKYAPSNWMKVENGKARYTDAMMRHWLAEQCGETHDQESECLHAAAVAWNALARLHFILQDFKQKHD